jgi:hypothetical protein
MNYNITQSDQQKYVWYRTAKCCTRSILHFLLETTDVIVNEYGVEFDMSWKDYFKFSIVRNPWDRLVSTWSDKVQKQWIEHKTSSSGINFFEKYKDKDYSFFIKDIIPCKEIHIECLSNLIDLNNIDFIGRFENIQKDFDIICDKIGIPQQQLPHRNKTNHKHYTEYYDDETREIVAQKYARDIEYFGYKFGE